MYTWCIRAPERLKLRKKGIPKARADLLLRLMRKYGSVTVERICADADVSPVTARRDLRELEALGLLRRTKGGATPIEPLLYEPFLHDSTFHKQLERYAAEKRRIGLAAADLVRDGETIACTAGTTTTEAVRCLRHRTDLRLKLVTNAVNIAMEVSQERHIELFLTGGHMRGDWFSLAGGDAIRTVRQYFVDTAIIGVNGIDPDRGFTCFNADEAVLNATMSEQARRKVVVADHSKLLAVATHQICPIETIDILITDTGASGADIAPYRGRGIEIRRV